MNSNENDTYNTRQFEILDKNRTGKRDYKKLWISLVIVIGLFLVAFALIFGIEIAKNGVK